VIFGSNWDLYKFSYSDVYEMENVRYIQFPSGIIGKGYAVYNKIDRKVSLPFHNLFYNSFFKNDFKDNKPIIFIHFGGWINNNRQSQMINYYRHKFVGSKHILFLQDLVKTDKWSFPIEDAKRDYDFVMSFDPGDCKKYGLIYHPLVFSNYKLNNYPLKYDVYFLGQAKNRLKEIYDAYDLLVQHNLKVKFLLKGVEDKDKRICDGLDYFTQNISYLGNLKYIEESKCILEIMQKGGTGYTQRGCEIVGLNKKLITNNTYIKNAPFYNKKYISTFDSIEKIDVDFLKRLTSTEVVEYGVEFRTKMSPKELLMFIENMT